MISEGSCDTKDWNNDAENSALHHKNKLHFKIHSNIKHIILLYYIPPVMDISWTRFEEHVRQKTKPVYLVVSLQDTAITRGGLEQNSRPGNLTLIQAITYTPNKFWNRTTIFFVCTSSSLHKKVSIPRLGPCKIINGYHHLVGKQPPPCNLFAHSIHLF